MSNSVSDFPRVDVTFRPEGTVEVHLLGVSHTFEPTGEQPPPKVQALRYLWQVANSPDFARPIRVHTQAPEGSAVLVVTPDGHYYDETMPHASYPLEGLNESPAPETEVAAVQEEQTAPSTLDVAPSAGEHRAEVIAGPDVPQHHQRKSFISTGPALEPARQGWRGRLNRVGLRLGPGRGEVEWRSDVHAVSQHWPGPRTVAIANGKGSANKTPTTVMLAAVFARYGGAGVLAWDNNETRGSLAWRTQQSNHDATVIDLIPRVDDLLGTDAQSAEMSYFAHHQPNDKFDVLRSDQSVEGDHEVSADDVARIFRVAARYYRMILMDSGNNERAANWRAMIERADALVLPCTNVEDTPEAGALMLEALASRDAHSNDLAEKAVAIVSKRTPGKDPNMDRIVRDLGPLVREVVTIPFDPALVSGVIHFDSLRTDTQRAWLRAAAAVARGL